MLLEILKRMFLQLVTFLGGRCRRRVVDVRFRQEQLAQEVAEGKHELRVLVDSRLDGVSPSSEKLKRHINHDSSWSIARVRDTDAQTWN